MRHALVALLCAASAARANPLELFGFTGRGAAMAGAQTALGDDVGSAFYNPAGLVSQRKTELAVGFGGALPGLHIDRALASSKVASAMPPGSARMEGGVVIPVGGYFAGWLAVGAAMGAPLDKILRIENLDSSRPQFVLYQSKPQRFSATIDAAVKLPHGLAVGVGLQIAQEQSGVYKFGLDVASKRVTLRETHVDARFAPVPVAGVTWDLASGTRLGLVWRGEQVQKTDVPTSFDIEGLGTLDIRTGSSSFYWPHTFSLGAAGRPASLGGSVLASVQLDVQLWSHAPSDEVQFEILPTGEVLNNLGFSGLLGFRAPARTAGFQTVLVPRAGLEVPLSRRVQVRAGVSMKPAVTPEQSGSTSYLDALTTTFAAGVGIELPSVGAALPEPLRVDVGAQLSWMAEREMKKSGGDNATGDARFGGVVFSFAATARYAY